MNKKVVVKYCEDCQFYEVHTADNKVVDQFCYKLNVAIHKNITMNFPENCPLEDDK